MNELKVRKRSGWYYIFCDTQLVYSAVAIDAVLSWLEENFSPPIKVRWFVGTTKHETKNI